MRRLCGVMVLLLLVSSGYAQDDVQERLVRIDDVGGGSLLIETRHPGVYVEAVTVGTDVTIGVTGMLARARVAQQFVNTLDSCVDAKYVFPLPAGAAVDAYRMRIGGRTIEGEVREREEAKRVFEEARAEGRAASIVERERPNVFSLSLANVGAKETIEVEIEYQATVPFADGVFELRFPTVVAPRYEPAAVPESTEEAASVPASEPMPDIRYDAGRRGNPLRLSVDLDPGVPLASIESPSHAVDEVHLSGTRHLVSIIDHEQPADRDFVLRWVPLPGREPRAARFSETTVDGSHAEMLFILPPDAGMGGVIPKEVVFIIDTSGSMEGPSIMQAKAALRDAVERLRPVDSFEIIEFNSETRRMFGALEAVDERTRENALEWIDRLRADGGTEMEPALATALGIPIVSPSAVRQVVFITDGQVGNEAGLFRFVSSRLGASRLFVVGIGSAPNENLMRLVAKAGRGTCTFVGRESEVQSKMGALFRKIESPVLTGITIETDEGVVVQPSPVPDLYAGEPLVVTLRSDRAAPRLRVAARGGSLWHDDLSRSVSRETSGISRLVAQREVESLEESVILGAAEEEVKAKVVELALGNRLVTKYTAFVAVDRSGPVEGEVCESVPVEVNLPAGWGGVEGGSLPQGGTAAKWLLLQGIALLGAALALRGRSARSRETERIREMTIAAQPAESSFGPLTCSLTVMLLLIAGMSLVAEAAWIDAKAWLAQRLLERAWKHAQDGGGEPKPWPWADTYPVARLRFARQGVTQIVLAGASGPTLAFGPGHVAGTARPGTAGNVAIAGHRDTHFSILRDARPGDVVELEAPDGTTRAYHVRRTDIVDESETRLLRDGSGRLTLVTCYPFDAARPGGRLRWVVTADLAPPSS